MAAASSIEINGGNGVFIMDGSVEEEPAKSSRQKGRVCWPLSNLVQRQHFKTLERDNGITLFSRHYRLVNFECLENIIIK